MNSKYSKSNSKKRGRWYSKEEECPKDDSVEEELEEDEFELEDFADLLKQLLEECRKLNSALSLGMAPLTTR